MNNLSLRLGELSRLGFTRVLIPHQGSAKVLPPEGMTVVHLGDLGCALTAAQEEKISGCDALMLPVGGTYTIDAAAAAELVRRLHPRLVLPMHFRRGEQGFPELTTLEDFLSRLPEQPVHRLTGETLDLTSKGTSGIVIFPRR